jgi:hypothetical protein
VDAALLVTSALASGYPLGREIAGTAPDRGPKNGRLANPFGKATIFNQLQRHSRLVAPAGCTDLAAISIDLLHTNSNA